MKSCEKDEIMFLHIGKAGGGTVWERLDALDLPHSRCHPNSCPRCYDDAGALLINIRDPVDRFVSNFYWTSLLMCRADEGDTRLSDNTLAINDPENSCSDVPVRREMIDIRYKGNASLLAESFCDDEKRSQALDDIHLFGHSRQTITQHWLGNYWRIDNGTAMGAKLATIVLEPGFDLLAQIDLTAEWAKSMIAGEEAASDWAIDARAKAKLSYGKGGHYLHSSSTNISKKYTPEPLTDLGICCIAKHYYEKDYLLLAGNFANLTCKNEICKNAIKSIVNRRKLILNRSLSCKEVTKVPLLSLSTHRVGKRSEQFQQILQTDVTITLPFIFALPMGMVLVILPIFLFRVRVATHVRSFVDRRKGKISDSKKGNW